MPSPSPRTFGYTPPAQPEFFVQTPVSIVRCHTLSPVAKTTYEVLLSYRDPTGVAHPGQARLAAEVGVSEPTIRRALQLLAAVGLVEPTRRGQGLTNTYRVHRSPLRVASSDQRPASSRPERKERPLKNTPTMRSKTHKAFVELDPVQRDPEERNQPPSIPSERGGEGGGCFTPELAQQINEDAVLITRTLGMDPDEAVQVAQDAATQGQPSGYIAELVAHVTRSPSVQNPAGCLRALVQRGKRRPPRGAGGVPSRAQRAALHPEHYGPGGKYAHLFRRASAVRGEECASVPSPQPQPPTTDAPLSRGPSAFEVAANPVLAGRSRETWPRGQPLTGL